MRTCSCAAGSAAGNGAAPRGLPDTASTCRISPDSAFVQVNAQIQRQDEEPARGLEPPTPCLQAKLTAIRLVLPRVRSAVTCGYVRVDRVRSSVKDHPDRAVSPRFLPLPCRRSRRPTAESGDRRTFFGPHELGRVGRRSWLLPGAPLSSTPTCEGSRSPRQTPS